MIWTLALPPVLAADLPGWRAVGPERGHVIDVAVSGHQVWAATRPGVFHSAISDDNWLRSPQFPAGVRRLTAAEGGLWAATARGLWLVADQARLVAKLPEGGVAVDLAGAGDAAVMAIRGPHPGVWRIAESGESRQVLDGVDPWVFAASPGAIWLGTLGQGVWRSTDEGLSFQQVAPALTVSGLAWIDETLFVGLSDGRVTRGLGGPTACATVRGAPIVIGEVDRRIVVIVDGDEGARGDLYECRADGELVPMQVLPTAEDGLRVQPTGLWSLDAHRALVGTFRSGPLVLDDDGARPWRTGFRATLTSAVTTTEAGEVLLALMSTGVFRTQDAADWTLLAGRSERPVSDAMDVVSDGERFLVLDFDGLVLGRADQWYRTEGAAVSGAGRKNALVELGVGSGGALWGRDYEAGLWAQGPAGWVRCAASGITRIEGQGDALVLASARGYLRPSCERDLPLAWAGLTGETTSLRSDGRWVAGAGRLWRDGAVVADIPFGAVAAIAARGEEVLVAGDGPVQRCAAAGCVGVARVPPGPVTGIGWLEDGRIWAAERQGSFLVADAFAGESAVADAATTAAEGAPEAGTLGAPSATTDAEVPPWRGAGRAGFGSGALPKAGASTLPVAKASPVAGEGPTVEGADVPLSTPTPWRRWAILGVEILLAAAGLLLIVRAPRRPRRRQK